MSRVGTPSLQDHQRREARAFVLGALVADLGWVLAFLYWL